MPINSTTAAIMCLNLRRFIDATFSKRVIIFDAGNRPWECMRDGTLHEKKVHTLLKGDDDVEVKIPAPPAPPQGLTPAPTQSAGRMQRTRADN